MDQNELIKNFLTELQINKEMQSNFLTMNEERKNFLAEHITTLIGLNKKLKKYAENEPYKTYIKNLRELEFNALTVFLMECIDKKYVDVEHEKIKTVTKLLKKRSVDAPTIPTTEPKQQTISKKETKIKEDEEELKIIMEKEEMQKKEERQKEELKIIMENEKQKKDEETKQQEEKQKKDEEMKIKMENEKKQKEEEEMKIKMENEKKQKEEELKTKKNERKQKKDEEKKQQEETKTKMENENKQKEELKIKETSDPNVGSLKKTKIDVALIDNPPVETSKRQPIRVVEIPSVPPDPNFKDNDKPTEYGRFLPPKDPFQIGGSVEIDNYINSLILLDGAKININPDMIQKLEDFITAKPDLKTAFEQLIDFNKPKTPILHDNIIKLHDNIIKFQENIINNLSDENTDEIIKLINGIIQTSNTILQTKTQTVQSGGGQIDKEIIKTFVETCLNSLKEDEKKAIIATLELINNDQSAIIENAFKNLTETWISIESKINTHPMYTTLMTLQINVIKILLKKYVSGDIYDLINKTLTSLNSVMAQRLTQKGGGGGFEDKHIKQAIDEIAKQVNILNTDMILKIMAIMTDKNIFDDLIKTKFDKKQILDLFFIELNNDEMKNIGLKYEGNTNLISILNIENEIGRDTYIYNRNETVDAKSQKIFVYTLIKKIINTETAEIFQNNLISHQTAYLLGEILYSLENIIIVLREMKEFYPSVDIKYNEIVAKKQKIFGFIKERNDTNPTRNPRYVLSKDKTGKMLYLKYLNCDIKFSGDAKKGDAEKLLIGNIFELNREEAILKQEQQNKTESDDSIKKKQTEIDKKRAEILHNLGDVKENTIDKLKNITNEQYYFGTFAGIYLSTDSVNTNADIAKNIGSIMINKLTNQNEDVCIIGYGQSGSGKTSSLIYLNSSKPEKADEDGILIEMCNLKEFYDNFKEIQIEMKKIYVHHGSGKDSLDEIKEEHYKKDNIINYKAFFTHDEKMGWIEKGGDKMRIGNFIINEFKKREIEPTPNNANSSRSHVIVCLTLTNKDENKVKRKLIICDFAGVENKFDCDNITELLKFDNKYSTSEKYEGKNIAHDRYFCDQPESYVAFGKEKTKLITEMYNKDLNEENEKKEIIGRWNMSGGDNGCVDDKKIKMLDNCSAPLRNINPKISYEANIKFLAGELMKLENTLNNKYNVNVLLPMIKKIVGDDETANAYINNKKGYEQDFNILKIFFEQNKKDKEAIEKNKNRGMIPKNTKPTENKIDLLIRKLIQLDSKISPNKLKKFFENDPKKISATDKEIFINAQTEIIGKIDEYKKYACDYFRLKKIKHNCYLRKNEGLIINKSLSDLRVDIKSLIFNSLKMDNEKYLPVFYEKQIHHYCRNINVGAENYESFYNVPEKTSFSGVLMKVLKDYGVTTDTLNFGIFNVINTSNKETVNNVPNPPYINTNYIKYCLNDKKYMPELKIEFDRLIETIMTYSFYENDNATKKIHDTYKNAWREYNDGQCKSLCEKLINILDINNASTLIGSIEDTEKMQTVVYKYTCSYNPKFKPIIDELNEITTSETTTSKTTTSKLFTYEKPEDALTGGNKNAKYEKKYLKYKLKQYKLNKH